MTHRDPAAQALAGTTLRRIFWLALAATATLLASGIPAGAQQVELRWNFEAGDEHLYEMSQLTRTHMGGMGEMMQTQTTRYRQEVVDVDADGTARIEVTYDAIRMEMDGPAGSMSWDSDVDEADGENPLGMGMGGMVGQTFTVVVTSDGIVRSVEGVDAMMEAMLEGAPPEARAIMESTFGDEGMVDMMQQSFQSFPSGPVEPGADWESSISVNVGFGTMTSTYLHTLREVTQEDGRTVALISVEGETGGLDPDPDNPMAAMIQSEGGPVKGEIVFDVERGLMIRGTTETTVRMSAMGQDMSITSEMTLRLVN